MPLLLWSAVTVSLLKYASLRMMHSICLQTVAEWLPARYTLKQDNGNLKVSATSLFNSIYRNPAPFIKALLYYKIIYNYTQDST